MPKPFDAALKDLVYKYPRDWLAQFGLPATAPVEMLDTDLSTITTQADRLILVRDAVPWIFHVELQSSRDSDLGLRTLEYSVLVHRRTRLPVHSLVILLRREAEDQTLTGEVSYRAPAGRGGLQFEFDVVRLWQRPVEPLLAGGLGTLPLAPLADFGFEALPGVVTRMNERLAIAPQSRQAELWTATYILMGLRYPADLTDRLLREVRAMRDSVTYQAILAEGEAEGALKEARKLLLSLGTQRFGRPSAAVREALSGITTVERLERLSEHLLKVESWDELLAAG